MKPSEILAVMILLVGLRAQAQVLVSDSVTLNTAIPDGNPTGLRSTIEVSGAPERIQNVTVHLDVSGGVNGDLYAFLSHGDSGFAVLLNRVGKTASNPLGYEDAGFTLTLDDHLGTDVHSYGGNGGLTLKPAWAADGRAFDPLTVRDSDSRTALLNSFNDLNPNGTWSLFIADMVAGEQSTLVGWGIDITAIPEPASEAAVVAGLLVAAAVWRRRSRRQAR